MLQLPGPSALRPASLRSGRLPRHLSRPTLAAALLLGGISGQALLLAACDGSRTGNSGEGEGEGEEPLIAFTLTRGDGDGDGGLVESSFPRDVGMPLAGARLGGTPVLLSAEVVDRAVTGALLLHMDPLAEPPGAVVRVEGVVPAFSVRPPPVAVTAGDLDDDGDLDLVVRVGSSSVVVVLDGGEGPPRALVRGLDGPAQPAGVLSRGGNTVALVAALNANVMELDVVAGALVATTVRHEGGRQEPYILCATGYAPAAVVTSLVARLGVCGITSTAGGAPRGPDHLATVGEDLSFGPALSLGLAGNGTLLRVGDRIVAHGSGYTSEPGGEGEVEVVFVDTVPALAVTARMPGVLLGAARVAGAAVAVPVVATFAPAQVTEPALVLGTPSQVLAVAVLPGVNSDGSDGDVVLVARPGG